VGEQPGLWTWVVISVHLGNLARVPAVLSNRRLRCMRGLHLQVVSEELLEAVVQHPGLKVINMADCSLFVNFVNGKRSVASIVSIDSNLLADVIEKTEDVRINMKSSKSLSTEQAGVIFQRISTGSSLKKFQLNFTSLRSLPSHLLARSLCQLESVELENTSLTSHQLETLFNEMKSNSKLLHLNLSDNPLSDVNPITMVSSLCKLESLSLAKTSLSTQQLNILCSTWAQSTPSLKHLDLSRNDLSSVPAKHLADIALHMESLDMSHAKLTSDQANDLCTAVGHSRNLTSFDLSYNNLSHVNWLVIQRLVAKVEKAVLDLTELTHTLTWRLFEGLPSSKIKVLSIAGVDLSAVEADHFGRMVAQLEEVNLEGTRLTPEQTVAIFASLDGPSNLHTLKIGGNKLSRVAPDQMARAVNKLRVASMDMSVSITPPGLGQWLELTVIEKLTFEQLLAVLTKSLEGTLLTSLKIGPVFNEARLKHETEVIDKATNAIKDLIIVKESKW